MSAPAGAASLREWGGGDAFEDAVGGGVGGDEGGGRNEQRLLEGELAGHGGMGDAIGKHHPGGERRKFQERLGRVLLKVAVLFQVIVEAQHEAVVRRAAEPREPRRSRPARDVAAQQSVFAGEAADAGVGGVFFGDVGEIADGIPDARLRGVQIGEDAQDASAARGAQAKGIHVQQIVALVQRKVAPLLLERTEAGVVGLPFTGVRAQEIAQKLEHVGAVVAQDVVQMRLGAVVAGKSAHGVIGGAVGDVFVQAKLVPFAGKQEFTLIGRKLVGQLREK